MIEQSNSLGCRNVALRTKGRTLLFIFITFVFSICVSLILVELFVRLIQPQTLILRRPDVWYGIEGLGWNRTPDLNTIVNFGGAGQVKLITDEEGNRIDFPLEELGYDSRTMDLQQPYKMMKTRLEERGLHLVDLMPVFEQQLSKGISCYGDVDSHFSKSGHQIAASVVLPHVLKRLSAAE